MAKRSLLAGSTSVITYAVIRDVNGSPITGLVFNSSGLKAYYCLPGAASVSISLVTQTVTGAYSSGGFVEIDSTNMPGLYRLDVPNAALASSNVSSVICLSGATGMAALYLEFDLWAVNPQDATAFGISRIDATISSRMATFTLPANFSSLAITGGGSITVGTNNDKTGYGLASGQLFIKKNTAVVFPFVMLSSTDHVTPKTGLTVTATRSLDGAAFAACANAVTELSNGWYVITLATTDTNATAIGLRFSATGADDRDVTIYTQA